MPRSGAGGFVERAQRDVRPRQRRANRSSLQLLRRVEIYTVGSALALRGCRLTRTPSELQRGRAGTRDDRCGRYRNPSFFRHAQRQIASHRAMQSEWGRALNNPSIRIPFGLRPSAGPRARSYPGVWLCVPRGSLTSSRRDCSTTSRAVRTSVSWRSSAEERSARRGRQAAKISRSRAWRLRVSVRGRRHPLLRERAARRREMRWLRVVRYA